MNLRNRTGEEGRRQTLCDNVTIILFEKTCKTPENINLRKDHDKTRKQYLCHVCHTQTFCRPLVSAVLLRKLTVDTAKLYVHFFIPLMQCAVSLIKVLKCFAEWSLTRALHSTGGPSSLCEFKMAVNIKDLYGNSGKRFKSINTR